MSAAAATSPFGAMGADDCARVLRLRYDAAAQASRREPDRLDLRSEADKLRRLVEIVEGPRCVTSGKVPYPDEETARAAVDRLLESGRSKGAAGWDVWFCVHCNKHHTGHRDGYRVSGRTIRRRR